MSVRCRRIAGWVSAATKIPPMNPSMGAAPALYNTDGQVFSESAAIVLFMENYDISRTGYHDTLDTMANIDLDYCAAMTAIAIETVADTACAP